MAAMKTLYTQNRKGGGGDRDVGKKKWKRNDMNAKWEFTNWMEIGNIIHRKSRNENA